jgi:hypothetical protein
LFVSGDRFSLYSPGRLQTCYSPASSLLMLGLQTCTIPSWRKFFVFFLFLFFVFLSTCYTIGVQF